MRLAFRAALGQVDYEPKPSEQPNMVFRRSLYVVEDVAAGEAFTPHNLGGKRPGTGLATARIKEIWGRTATRNLDVNTLLTGSDFA